MPYYFQVIKKYAVFRGRASRKEFWYYLLSSVIIVFVLGILNAALGADVPALPSYYSLAVLLPSLAVAVRRLHDTGRSGWLVLLNLIPIIGNIWFLVLVAQDGTLGNNKYGKTF